jgi:serine/threonine protein kinase/WD40 repeat protein/tetratricopeptide (TPR) repeat protein
MSNSSEDRNPIEALAAEFMERCRRGERPALSEYAARYPELAQDIRDLFPALVMIEDVRPGEADVTGGYTSPFALEDKKPQRLGDYRILREVGRGGMGIVYEAEQESLGRHVALKVLPPHALLNPTFRERFRREAKAAAKLHHTHIVPVFGVGECDGVHFYAMQFIRGEGLDKVLHDLRCLRRAREREADDAPLTTKQPEGSMAESLLTGCFDIGPAVPPNVPRSAEPFPLNTPTSTAESMPTSGLSNGGFGVGYYRSVARIGLQVADALAYAHQQGVLHRDVKPSNVLLDSQGIAWITDFGLAKEAGSNNQSGHSDLTQTGDIVGTVRFMAPERFDGHSLPQSDVYGLGVTLYELLTLRPAFDDSNKARLVEKVLQGPPVRPRKIEACVPRDLETIVLKCLNKDPSERYGTAEALAEDLRRFLADRPIKARRTPWHERTWRWCRRNPAVAALLSSLLFALSAVAVVSTGAALKLKYERDQVQSAKDERDDEFTLKVEALRRATEADRDRSIELYKSYAAQAQASRWSGRPGRRLDSLDALAKAVRIVRSLDFSDEAERLGHLRNEVIAAMALTDIRVAREWESGVAKVTGYAFDARQERYAVSDPQGNLSVRWTVDGREIVRLPNPGFGRHVYYLRFSPDGRMLASMHDGEWKWHLWDLNRREKVFSLAGGSFDFAPHGHTFACVFDNSIHFYSLEPLQEIRRVPIGDGGHTIAFAPDGKRLAVLNSNPATLQLLDGETGTLLRRWPAPIIGNLIPVCWREDSQRLAFGTAGGRVAVWDVDEGRQVLDFQASEGGVTGVAYSREGTVLATNGWNPALRLSDAETGRLLLDTPTGTGLQFSRDGRSLGPLQASASRIGLWQFAPSKELVTLQACPDKHHVDWIAISSSSRWLAAGCSDGVRLWDLPARRQIAHLDSGSATRVTFLPDESGLVAVGPPGSFLWPMAYGRGQSDAILQIGPPRSLGSPAVVAADWSSERKVFVLPGGNSAIISEPAWGQVDRVDLRDHRRSKLVGNLIRLSEMATSLDGRWLATSSYWFPSQPIKVWDLQTGKHACDLPIIDHAALVFSPDSQWLVTSRTSEFHFWKVGSWKVDRTIARKAGSSLHGAAFSPDGRMLALASGPEEVQLSDPHTGQEYGLLPHLTQRPIASMCFSPDGGQLVIAAGRDIQIWDLRLISEHLSAIDLDWGAPPHPPAKSLTDQHPLRVEVLKPPPREVQLRNQIVLQSLQSVFTPFHPEPYHQRGHAYDAQGQYQKAIDDYTEALRWQPADAKRQAHLYEIRAADYMHLKQHPQAAADYERVVTLLPEHALACNNLAWLYVAGPKELRNPGKALPLAHTATRLAPDNWQYLNTLGLVQYRHRLYEEAIKTLQRGIKANNRQETAFDLFCLAMCHARLGDPTKARDCFDRAVKWVDGQKNLPATWAEELKSFHAEAEEVLRSP